MVKPEHHSCSNWFFNSTTIIQGAFNWSSDKKVVTICISQVTDITADGQLIEEFVESIEVYSFKITEGIYWIRALRLGITNKGTPLLISTVLKKLDY